MSAPVSTTTPDISTPGRRIAELDVLRGFALCGILVINIIQQLVQLRAGAPRVFPLPIDLVFYERFLAIFALLFGVGFGLFLARASARTAHPRAVLARRLAVLLVLGVAHQVVHPGEALAPYALIGLVVLLPLSLLGARACLAVAVVLLVLAPQVQEGYGLTVGLLALGFALARLGVPEALDRRLPRVAGCLAVCGVLAVGWAAGRVLGWAPPLVNVLGGGLGGAQSLLPPLAALATALAYVTAVLLLLRTRIGPALHALLAPMGRTALTNYLAATALFLTIGPLLRIDSLDDAPAIAGLTVGILAVQIVWSRAWLARFRYGPVEWAWRCLTWWRRAPLRR